MVPTLGLSLAGDQPALNPFFFFGPFMGEDSAGPKRVPVT